MRAPASLLATGTALAALLLLLLRAPASTTALSLWPSRGPSPEAALVDWVVASGGVANVRLGPVPGGDGLRGTLATRNVAAGDVLISVPSNMSVPLGDNAATSPESVILLLKRRFTYPDWYADMAPFWRMFPTAPFTKETFTDEEAAMLQDDVLTKASHEEILWARAVYEGRRSGELGPEVPTLAAALNGTGASVTWPEFQRWVSLVASYAFHLPDDAGVTRAVLLPLLDMINHGDADVANADVAREGGAFVARATADVAAGDEVTFSYSRGQARPDHSFMHYGFLNRARRDVPHVACIDLPGKTLWDCPGPTAVELGREVAPKDEAEAARLRALLAEFPTTEEEDRAELKRLNNKRDWRKALILEFRATRKRALRLAAARAAGEDGGSTAGRVGGVGAEHNEL